MVFAITRSGAVDPRYRVLVRRRSGNRDIINCDDPFTVLICPLFN